MGITKVLQDILEVFKESFVLLLPYGKALLGSLAVLDIALLGIHFAVSGNGQVWEIIKKILFIGVLYYMLVNLPVWANYFMESLVEGGFAAAGSKDTWNIINNPGGILNIAVSVLAPISEAMGKLGAWKNLGTLIFFAVVFLLVSIAFSVIAIIICMTLLEYHLFVIMCAILLPWTAIKPGRFFGQKIISGVVHFGVRLMVLAFLLSLLKPMMLEIISPEAVNFASGKIDSSKMVSLLAVTLLFTYLIIKGPPMIASMFTGAPSFGGTMGAVFGAMMGAVSMAKGAVMKGGGQMAGSSAGASSGASGSAGVATAGAAVQNKSKLQKAFEGIGNGTGTILRSAGTAVESVARGVGEGAGSAFHNPYKQKYAVERKEAEQIKQQKRASTSSSTASSGRSVAQPSAPQSSSRGTPASLGVASSNRSVAQPSGAQSSAPQSAAPQGSVPQTSAPQATSSSMATSAPEPALLQSAIPQGGASNTESASSQSVGAPSGAGAAVSATQLVQNSTAALDSSSANGDTSSSFANSDESSSMAQTTPTTSQDPQAPQQAQAQPAQAQPASQQSWGGHNTPLRLSSPEQLLLPAPKQRLLLPAPRR